MADNFNPRPSVRGDDNKLDKQQAVTDFNPRPSVRGDHGGFGRIKVAEDFNPRPSVRGDAPITASSLAGARFQSTPLREGRLDLLIVVGLVRPISIHAPP